VQPITSSVGFGAGESSEAEFNDESLSEGGTTFAEAQPTWGIVNWIVWAFKLF
jgi:hypothetical protein